MNIDKEELEVFLKRGDLSYFTTLINKGVDVNLMQITNVTDILLEAILKNKYFLIKKIFDNKFNIKANNFNYLLHAIQCEKEDIIELIINEYKNQNKDFKDIDNDDNNLLHTIVLNDNINFDIILNLTASDVSWYDMNKNGKTPLHLLLEREIMDNRLIEYLKQNDSLLNIKDKAGVSARDLIQNIIKKQNNKNINWELISV